MAWQGAGKKRAFQVEMQGKSWMIKKRERKEEKGINIMLLLVSVPNKDFRWSTPFCAACL